MGEAVALKDEASSLADFCFAYTEVFLIPAEHLSSHGMSPEFRAMLRDRRGVSPSWIDRFNEAFQCYHERITALATRAPSYWRAPRCANVCIVQDALRTRPYYLPFSKSSWLLYESDFDSEESNLEFATYQLVHVERLGMTGDPAMTWIHNLGYFMERSPEERAAFVEGCAASTRPDAEAFRSLASLMEATDSFAQDQLRPGSSEAGTSRIAFAGLNVPEAHQATFQTVAKSFLAEAHNATHRYYAAQTSRTERSSADALVAWLSKTAPHVVLTDQFGGTLWDCARPERVEDMRAVLEGIGERAATSLQDDWSVIDRHSRAFLSALVDPDSLTFPDAGLDQEDGIFLHAERKMIAYSLVQPGLRALAEEAPPYHRLLVGARTIHEWGHLAAEAGVVRVPEERAIEHERARKAIIEAFDAIVDAAPSQHRDTAAREVELLRRQGYRLGDMPLQRIGDYQANLLAREFLSSSEMEAYVRANVRPLIDEPDVGPYLGLARYAYEYQYLRLSEIDDPFAYLVSTTWFAETYFDEGIIDESQCRALFDGVGSLVDCYEIDRTRIRLS